MVTALQAAMPPARKPKKAEGFLTMVTGATVGIAATANGAAELCNEGFGIVGDEVDLDEVCLDEAVRKKTDRVGTEVAEKQKQKKKKKENGACATESES